MMPGTEHPPELVAHETSPDGNIRAMVTGRADVRVTFQPRTFTGYDEPRVSHQLGHLAASTWDAAHQRRTEIFQRSLGLSDEELAAAQRPSDDPTHRRYLEELRAIEGYGQSTGAAVRIRCHGTTNWRVEIAPGAPRHLGEQSFVDELHTAIQALITDRRMKTVLLKARHFDLGLPAAWRDFTRDLMAGRLR